MLKHHERVPIFLYFTSTFKSGVESPSLIFYKQAMKEIMYTIAFHGHDHGESMSNFNSRDSCYYKDFENSEMSFIGGFISSSWEIMTQRRKERGEETRTSKVDSLNFGSDGCTIGRTG